MHVLTYKEAHDTLKELVEERPNKPVPLVYELFDPTTHAPQDLVAEVLVKAGFDVALVSDDPVIARANGHHFRSARQSFLSLDFLGRQATGPSNITATITAAFFLEFYQELVDKGKPLHEAFRKAVLRINREHDNRPRHLATAETNWEDPRAALRQEDPRA